MLATKGVLFQIQENNGMGLGWFDLEDETYTSPGAAQIMKEMREEESKKTSRFRVVWRRKGGNVK